MKEYKQLGAYALIIEDNSILLIKKNGGPYHGKLDLPGGTIEFGERPEEALKRELLEEVGIEIKEYNLFDTESVFFDWDYKEKNVQLKVHHIGIYYKVNKYINDVKSDIEIDEQNDDSLGALFVPIKELSSENLSPLALIELKKLGFNIKD
jgi:mutator protein MutT